MSGYLQKPGGGGGGTWGSITGTLSNQTDLQNTLNLKYDASNPAGYITSSALSGYLQNNVGIAGGTTLIGGTASGNNLTLVSTSNATKGKILFGTSAYDEVNNRLGIGITSPLHSIDTTGNIRINTGSFSYLYFGTTGASISQGNIGIDRFLLTAPTSGDIELLTKSTTGVRFQRSSGDIYTSFPDVSTTNQSIIFGGDFYGSYRSVGTSAAVIERNGSDLYFSANSALSGGYASFTPNKILTISGANSRVGIGTTTPTARLHLPAGAASANTAPLKFTAGTNLTTAESGAIEYNNTFHVTNSDATRRHIVTAPNTTKVTASAPYTNDGYITINIGGTDFKVMTTA